MTGHLRTTLHDRAETLDDWQPDVGDIVRAGRRRVRVRHAAATAGVVAAVMAVASLIGPTRDRPPSIVPAPLTTHGPTPQQSDHRAGRTSQLVHTRYFDVPRPPDGYHVVGSLPAFAAMTRDGTVDDLYRDTQTELPQADITQILRVFYNAYAVSSSERHRDPAPGTPIRFDGRTFFANTTWDPEVDYVQYQRADGTWLRLQYPKRDHFPIRTMVAFLDRVRVNAGAVPSSAGGAPQG